MRSLEPLLLSKCEALLDPLKAALEEGVPLQVKVVFLEPLFALLVAVELLEVGVLDFGSSVPQNDHEA